MKIGTYLRIVPEMSSVLSGNYFSSPYGISELQLDALSSSVLETSLNLKDKLNCSLTAFSCASKAAIDELTRVKMFGVDKCYLFETNAAPDVLQEAKICADFMRNYDIDILLVGANFEYMHFSTIAPLISSISTLPYVENVRGISVIDNMLNAVYESYRGAVKIKTIPQKCIISYCGKDLLRYPILKNRLNASNSDIEINHVNYDNNNYNIEKVNFTENKIIENSVDNLATSVLDIFREKGVIQL